MPARKDFDRHLQKEDLLPVYAIFSGEPMLLKEALSALRGRALTAAADFNRDELRAGDVPAERAIQAASTMPMMAPRRFVHLFDAQRLEATESAPLLAYLEKASPTTVFCISGDKIDQRTKLAQKLAASGGLFLLEAPRPQELAAWIERRAKSQGHAIERDAAQLLADLLGNDLGGLDMALLKLATYAAGETIATEHVEATVAPTRIDSIFKLTDAIGSRDLTRASLLLRNLLGGGESALSLLAMIARQLRHLMHVKELTAQRASASDIAQRVGVPPFLVQPLAQQATRYEPLELCRALDAVARADVRLKSSKLAAGVVLDRLLLEIVAGGEQASA